MGKGHGASGRTHTQQQCQGIYTSNEGEYSGNGYFWLRSPSDNFGSSALSISYDGDWSNYSVISADRGVVPALEINL